MKLTTARSEAVMTEAEQKCCVKLFPMYLPMTQTHTDNKFPSLNVDAQHVLWHRHGGRTARVVSNFSLHYHHQLARLHHRHHSIGNGVSRIEALPLLHWHGTSTVCADTKLIFKACFHRSKYI